VGTKKSLQDLNWKKPKERKRTKESRFTWIWKHFRRKKKKSSPREDSKDTARPSNGRESKWGRGVMRWRKETKIQRSEGEFSPSQLNIWQGHRHHHQDRKGLTNCFEPPGCGTKSWASAVQARDTPMKGERRADSDKAKKQARRGSPLKSGDSTKNPKPARTESPRKQPTSSHTWDPSGKCEKGE